MLKKEWLIALGIGIVWSLIVFLIISFNILDDLKLNQNQSTLVLQIITGIFGLVSVAIQDKVGNGKNFVKSLEVLLLIMMPTLATFPFFDKSNESFFGFPLLLLVVSSCWYAFYVGLINIQHELKQVTFRAITIFYGCLLFIIIITMVSILQNI